MNDTILNEYIDRLNISCNVIEQLKNNEIVYLRQLCSKSKTYLKNLGLETITINKIEIELQLLGLNLKTNY